MAEKGYKAFRPRFYCEAPLDTLDYYPLLDDECRMTEFAEAGDD